MVFRLSFFSCRGFTPFTKSNVKELEHKICMCHSASRDDVFFLTLPCMLSCSTCRSSCATRESPDYSSINVEACKRSGLGLISPIN